MSWWPSRVAGRLSGPRTTREALALALAAVIPASAAGLGLDAALGLAIEDGATRSLLSVAGAATLAALPFAVLLLGAARQLEASRGRVGDAWAWYEAAKRRFGDFVDCSSDWLWETDEGHRFVYFSGRHDEVVGVPTARRLGIKRTELRNDDPANDDFDAHLGDLEHRRPFRNFRYAFVDEQGRRHVVLVSGNPVFDTAGRFRGYRGIGHEITEAYEQEQALRDREARLSKAQRVARLGDWRWIVGTNEVAWSVGTHHIFGVDPRAFKVDLAAFVAMVHPDDRSRVFAQLDAAARQGEGCELEYRAIRADGVLRHIWADAVPEKDERGEVCAFFGVCQDVTERKQAEIALRASEDRLRHFAQASSDWFWETDSELRFTYISDQMQALTSIDVTWILGKRREELVGDVADDERWVEHLADLQARRPFRDFIYHYATPDGRERYIRTSGVPVFDADGNFHGYRGTGTEITEQVRAQERIRHLAHHDALTGLPNRALFQDRLHQALAQARRGEHKVALLQLDLDRFKDINDTLGHPAGDALLRETAARLRDCVRGSDTVARLGGDEFAVILTELRSSTDAGRVAQKLVETLARPVEFQGQTIHTGTSIGITVFPTDATAPEHLLKNADIALYQAKDLGRGSYSFFVRAMKEQVERRKRIENDLRAAVASNEFTLLYQPLIRLADFSLRGFEVLLRWQQRGRGDVSPTEFIAVADDCGLSVSLGELVLRRACAQARAWLDSGHDPGRVGVNVAMAQFRRGGLDDSVREILAETGLAPQYLELEITESVLLERHKETVFDVMSGLHGIGVSFALDDFGTGFASLGHLKHFPVDRLKIDRSFVRDIGTDPDDAALARTVINLGQSLGLEVVAEGVETEEQLGFLRLNGCNLAQGFYFAPPMSASEAARFLARSSGCPGPHEPAAPQAAEPAERSRAAC